MSQRLRLACWLGVLLLTSASAHAGTLTSATWHQVVDVFGFVPGIPITRTAAQLSASGTSTAGSVAASLSFPNLATTFIQPGMQIDLAFQVNQGGVQAISATPGMGAGTPGIPGTVAVMSALHIAKGVNQSMFHIGQTLLVVPLSHGKAGQFTGTFFAISGVLHRMTVDFYAWSPGTLVFTGLSSVGQPLPDVTAMGSFNLTANGGGTVTLVSPSKISIDSGGIQLRTVSLTTLALTFVPEPSTLLLIAAGVVGLVLRERRRSP